MNANPLAGAYHSAATALPQPSTPPPLRLWYSIIMQKENTVSKEESKTKKTKEMKEGWHILIGHLKKYRFLLIFSSGLMLIISIINGVTPYIFGLFVDAMIDVSKTVTIGGITIVAWKGILVLWVFLHIISYIVNWFTNRKNHALGMKASFDYQVNAVNRLLFVPISFHKNERSGELLHDISRGSGIVSSNATRLLPSLLRQISTLIIGIIMISFINPIFTFIIILGVLPYILLIIRLHIPLQKLTKESESVSRNVHGIIREGLTNIISVKHMTAEKHENEKIVKLFFKHLIQLRDKISFIWSTSSFSQQTIVLATEIVIFIFSVFFIQDGSLTIGEFVALNSYSFYLFGPFSNLTHQWQTLQDDLVAIKIAEEKIFKTKQENYHPVNAYTPKRIDGAVQFKDVSFAYDTPIVLDDLTFSVNAGERIAFVGKSGVGKSTVTDLISGYYFPTKGEVLIDGHDTRKIDIIALRSSIAVVPQEPLLFNDTAMMNIRYGRLDATDSEVMEAAKKARADEFIQELPEKYNQLVGERGTKLSVGQKQRIAIARAILRDPSILILDEPTSALDAETEKQIAESFEELMKGRTTFIVAHRLSTIRKADRILVFEKGTIVEEGTHTDLLKRENGVYKKLHDYQVGLY